MKRDFWKTIEVVVYEKKHEVKIAVLFRDNNWECDAFWENKTLRKNVFGALEFDRIKLFIEGIINCAADLIKAQVTPVDPLNEIYNKIEALGFERTLSP
jgi:hypothetical protein